MNYLPILECTRGSIVESSHDGIIAAAFADGRLFASYGDPGTIVYMRSSAKPFQAIPVVESGAAEHYSIIEQELAIMCSSHSGTDEHVDVLETFQKKVSISETDLQTGIHAPFDRVTARRLAAEGVKPSPNRHNCSGKHTGMLALASHLGAPFQEYTCLEHPVQQLSLKAVAEMCGLAPGEVVVGIDGCSVPTFAVPMRSAAAGYARLMEQGGGGTPRGAALTRIRNAMANYPFLVAGPERFDTALMEATHGRILAKGGAEGYQAIGIPAGNLKSDRPAFGITIKIKDCDIGKRAIAAVAMAVLTEFDVLTDEEEENLSRFAPQTLSNHAGLVIGETRPCFRLERGG